MVSKLKSVISCLLVGISIVTLLPIQLFAQQDNTVFAKIITAVVADTTTVVPSKYMVGQPYHMAVAIFSNRPTRTCSSVIEPTSLSIPVLSVGGSYDGVTYTDITLYTRPISPGSSSPSTNAYRMISSGSGAFPFLRLTVGNWNTVDCKVDVFYSGTIQSLDIKKYADFGTTTDTLRTFSIAISGAATTTIVSSAANTRIVVYGFMLTNSATNNITFQDVRADASTVILGVFNNTPAGAGLNAPNTNYPLFATSPGGTLNIITTGAGTLSGFLDFRSE